MGAWIAAATILSTLTVCALTWVWSPSAEDCRRATVWMESRTTYAFPVDEGDTLFCPTLSVPMFDTERFGRADSIGTSIVHSAFFISYDGCLIAPAEDDNLPTTDSIRSLLKQERIRLTHLSDALTHQLQELAYYGRTHSATDDGYTEVMTYGTELAERKGRLDSLLHLVEKLEETAAPQPEIHRRYRIGMPAGMEREAHATFIACHRRTSPADGLALYQTANRTLPRDCRCIRLPFWRRFVKTMPTGLVHMVAIYLQAYDTDSIRPAMATWLPLPCEYRYLCEHFPSSADGGLIIGRHGWPAGIYARHRSIPLATAFLLQHRHRPFWQRWKEETVAGWKRLSPEQGKEVRP